MTAWELDNPESGDEVDDDDAVYYLKKEVSYASATLQRPGPPPAAAQLAAFTGRPAAPLVDPRDGGASSPVKGGRRRAGPGRPGPAPMPRPGPTPEPEPGPAPVPPGPGLSTGASSRPWDDSPEQTDRAFLAWKARNERARQEARPRAPVGFGRAAAQASLRLQLTRDPHTWTCADVLTWLEFGAGLAQLRPRAAHHRLRGDVLLALTDDSARDGLGLTSLGLRRELMDAIAALKSHWAARIGGATPAPAAAEAEPGDPAAAGVTLGGIQRAIARAEGRLARLSAGAGRVASTAASTIAALRDRAARLESTAATAAAREGGGYLIHEPGGVGYGPSVRGRRAGAGRHEDPNLTFRPRLRSRGGPSGGFEAFAARLASDLRRRRETLQDKRRAQDEEADAETSRRHATTAVSRRARATAAATQAEFLWRALHALLPVELGVALANQARERAAESGGGDDGGALDAVGDVPPDGRWVTEGLLLRLVPDLCRLLGPGPASNALSAAGRPVVDPGGDVASGASDPGESMDQPGGRVSLLVAVEAAIRGAWDWGDQGTTDPTPRRGIGRTPATTFDGDRAVAAAAAADAALRDALACLTHTAGLAVWVDCDAAVDALVRRAAAAAWGGVAGERSRDAVDDLLAPGDDGTAAAELVSLLATVDGICPAADGAMGNTAAWLLGLRGATKCEALAHTVARQGVTSPAAPPPSLSASTSLLTRGLGLDIWRRCDAALDALIDRATSARRLIDAGAARVVVVTSPSPPRPPAASLLTQPGITLVLHYGASARRARAGASARRAARLSGLCVARRVARRMGSSRGVAAIRGGGERGIPVATRARVAHAVAHRRARDLSGALAVVWSPDRPPWLGPRPWDAADKLGLGEGAVFGDEFVALLATAEGMGSPAPDTHGPTAARLRAASAESKAVAVVRAARGPAFLFNLESDARRRMDRAADRPPELKAAFGYLCHRVGLRLAGCTDWADCDAALDALIARASFARRLLDAGAARVGVVRHAGASAEASAASLLSDKSVGLSLVYGRAVGNTLAWSADRPPWLRPRPRDAADDLAGFEGGYPGGTEEFVALLATADGMSPRGAGPGRTAARLASVWAHVKCLAVFKLLRRQAFYCDLMDRRRQTTRVRDSLVQEDEARAVRTLGPFLHV